MKVEVPQAALLSNAEVLAHLEAVTAKNRIASTTDGQPTQVMKSPNFETVLKEPQLTDYLAPEDSSRAPSPRAGASNGANGDDANPPPLPPYRDADAFGARRIRALMHRLEPFRLTQAELLMILNLRPDSLSLLDAIVEECDDRFSEDQQEEILQIVGSVLGGAALEAGEGELVNGSNAGQRKDSVPEENVQSEGQARH